MKSGEARKITTAWLKEKGFRAVKIQGSCNDFICPMGAFSVYVNFIKPWMDDCYIYEVGCRFDECERGGFVTVSVVDLPSNPHRDEKGHSQGLYYGELTREQYLQCLQEIYDRYLRPYFEQGLAYVKEILLHDTWLTGGEYQIDRFALRKLNALFGLDIQFPTPRCVLSAQFAEGLIRYVLMVKKFKRTKIIGGRNDYVRRMGEFDAYLHFQHDRRAGAYFFDAGVYFEDCNGLAVVRVRDLPSNPRRKEEGLYYGDGELSLDQFCDCLYEMYDRYIKPYEERGLAYLQEVLARGGVLPSGETYHIDERALEKLSELLGGD